MIWWNSEDAVMAPLTSTNSLLFFDIGTLDLHLGSDTYSKYGIVDRHKGEEVMGPRHVHMQTIPCTRPPPLTL